uniref:transposase n=1 Tax=Parasutterella sp. TaxID=2049037 RepID=UPI003AF15EF8
EQLARGCKNYENFLKTPGVGPFTAAMLCVLLCDPAIFANGRQFAAYIPNSQNIAPGFFHFEKNLS